MANYNALTPNEEKFIKDNFDKMSMKEISDALGRSYSTIQKAMKSLGFDHAHRWTKEEDEKLMAMYGTHHVAYIAHLFGVDENSVYNRVYRLRRKANKK